MAKAKATTQLYSQAVGVTNDPKNPFGTPCTKKQIEAAWENLVELLENDDPDAEKGIQNHYTVVWLFFALPEGEMVPGRMYMHPRGGDAFDFPVPYGTSIQSVKDYLYPLLRDGFNYTGYST